jgi:hypothetical protein
MSRAHELREQIENLEASLEAKRGMLRGLEKECSHQWPPEPEYIPEYHEAYTIPGDPPGTMGVDRQLPCHVPAKTIKRWRRTCLKCGMTQVTERTRKARMAGSIPGTSAEVDVPCFAGC